MLSKKQEGFLFSFLLPASIGPDYALLDYRNDILHRVGAILLNPFRYEGDKPTNIECHNIFPVLLRHLKAIQYRREHMNKHSIIGFAQPQSPGIFSSGLKKPLVLFYIKITQNIGKYPGLSSVISQPASLWGEPVNKSNKWLRDPIIFDRKQHRASGGLISSDKLRQKNTYWFKL